MSRGCSASQEERRWHGDNRLLSLIREGSQKFNKSVEKTPSKDQTSSRLAWTHRTDPIRSEPSRTEANQAAPSALCLQPMSFEGCWGEGGARPDGKMAASLDDDLDLNNQDYYALLNVSKEVWFVSYANISKRWQNLQHHRFFKFRCPPSLHTSWCRFVMKSVSINNLCRFNSTNTSYILLH